MDQLDERDRQAFAELQDKLIEQTNKKKQVSPGVLSNLAGHCSHPNWYTFYCQVANQLRSRNNEQKRALLTAEELNSLPDGVKTYEQIGRA